SEHLGSRGRYARSGGGVDCRSHRQDRRSAAEEKDRCEKIEGESKTGSRSFRDRAQRKEEKKFGQGIQEKKGRSFSEDRRSFRRARCGEGRNQGRAGEDRAGARLIPRRSLG